MISFKTLAALLSAFFIAMFIAPVFLRLAEKRNASQVILSYVEQHSGKGKTPTMGGFVFIVATVLSTVIFGGFRGAMTIVVMLIFAGYGIIGFLDDIIKIKLNRNMGLRAYQKVISQVLIAAIAAYYCSESKFIGTSIMLPIVGGSVNLGIWYIPFGAFVFLAMTNSVNLTDGLDGLAGTTNTIYLTFFLAITLMAADTAANIGDTLYKDELINLSIFIASLIGSLMAFLWFNTYKAKFFMGDTGSLALGGAAAAIALFSKNPLISILVGIMFVVSSISVIIQVLHFKRTKKRIFLMAPFHHHLELKGYNESKVVAFYSIITAVASVTALIII